MEPEKQTNYTVPFHIHNTIDAPQIDISNIRIRVDLVADATVAPTDIAPNGTIRWLYDATNYVQWNRMNNLWKSIGSVTSAQITTALGYTPENVANKDTTTTLGTSDIKYPSQNAVKSYVDTQVSSFGINETFTAGTTLQWSNDTLETATGTGTWGTYFKLKEITLNEDLPAVTLSGDVNGFGIYELRFFKNDNVIDATVYTSSGTYTKNLTNLVNGDRVGVFGKSNGGSNYGTIENFRLYFKREITKIQQRTLSTTLPTYGFITNPTNSVV